MPRDHGHRAGRRSKRRRHESPEDHDITELLIHAGLGDVRRCRRLLRSGVPVEACLADGITALHEASRCGQLAVARLLLRRGASTSRGDANGNTPVHVAAFTGHLDVASALLRSRRAPSLGQVNDAGVSVGDAVAAAMAGQDWATDSGGPTATQTEQRDRHAEERDWQARLADELADESGMYAAYFDAWAGSEPEGIDALAERLWREMEDKRAATRAATESAFRSRRAAETAAREAAAAEAAERSARILEEERARDRSWREAVAHADTGALRALYEGKWMAFVAKPPAAIGPDDVPWIPGAGDEPDPALLRRVVFYGAQGDGEQRKRVRAEQVRWHPDKFQARFSARLQPEQANYIMRRVVAVSQALNDLAADLVGG